jgi:hypothetical protein
LLGADVTRGNRFALPAPRHGQAQVAAMTIQ